MRCYESFPTRQNDPDRLDAVPEGAVVEVEDSVRLDHDAGGAILRVKCVNRTLFDSLGGIVDSCERIK